VCREQWKIWKKPALLECMSGSSGKRRRRGPTANYLFLLFLFCKGGPYPETCAQRDAGGGGFLLLELTSRGPELVSFVLSCFGHISLRDEQRCLEIKINK
jgi:hypothetical protein